MFKYEGLCCPVCHAKLFEDEDIAVCPDCGAPHHRECWKSIGKCYFSETHGTENQWKMPVLQPDINPGMSGENNIGNENSAADSTGEAGSVNTNPFGTGQRISMMDEDDETARNQAVNQILGSAGMNRDDDIDGEKASNLALFVGINITRYLRVFKNMALTKSKVGWNWIAFFLPQYWLISRKCYKPGILLIMYDIFTSLMINTAEGSGYGMINKLNEVMQNPILFFKTPSLIMISIISFIALIIHIFMGAFGDYIYKRHAYSAIKEMRENSEMSDVALMRKGGVNMLIPVAVYFAMNILVNIILLFIFR